ncbi:MAG: ankyrin repeat domain-containing protein [Mariprofundus sp.]
MNKAIRLFGFICCCIVVFPVGSAAEKNAMQDAGFTTSDELVTYIKLHRYAGLELLVMAGVDVNKADVKGETPLMQAVKSSDIEVARLLLNHGANPEALSDAENMPPLCRALLDGNLGMSKLLLDYGARVNARFITDKGFDSPVYLCALTDKNYGDYSPALYDLLIRSGSTLTDNVIQGGRGGETLLHMFAATGNLHGLKKWSEAGFSFDGLTDAGDNALHRRLDDQTSLRVARYLVAKGVNANAVNHDGETVLNDARRRSKLKTAAYLNEHIHKNTDLDQPRFISGSL